MSDTRKKICVHWIIFILLSICSILIIMCRKSYPSEYKWLPLLPLSFLFCSFFSINIIQRNKYNYGMIFLLYFLLVKNVIIPTIMVLGNYKTHIEVANNYIQTSIFITIYELIAIFVTLYFLQKKIKIYNMVLLHREKYVLYDTKRVTPLVIVLVLVFLATFFIVPQCRLIYQSIFQIIDINFTGNESNNLVEQYGSSFFLKLVLVIHIYLSKIIRFLLPLHFIVLIRQKRISSLRYMSCIFLSLLNLFIVDGTISRSLIYVFVLLLLTNILFDKEKNIFKVAAIVGILLFAYFYIRSIILPNNSATGYEYLSSLLTSYFSGLTNTAACIRMKDYISGGEKWIFFFYDYLQSIPFGNTIFNLQNISFQKMFNTISSSYGQIPTTIGTSYLYFGVILSPFYSVIFTILAFKTGAKAKTSESLMKQGIYILMTLYLCMAIVMYYTQITLSLMFTLIIPLLIIAEFAEKKKRSNNRRLEK